MIPLLAVPVSLIGTFAVFPLLGFSINTLSLFGLVLAIGLVVDDAIVVVEAVEHHIEEGMAPKEATFKAMEEVSGPVVAIALILSAVFLPTVFIPGITGRLYQQFAVTIAISVLLSAFNALTLSPALSALLLRPKRRTTRPAGLVLRLVQSRLWPADGRIRRRLPGVDPQIRLQPAVSRLGGAGGRLALGKTLPTGFLPEEDQGFCMSTCSFPRRLAGAHRGCLPEGGRRSRWRTPGVKSCHHRGRLQPAELFAQYLQRLLFG